MRKKPTRKRPYFKMESAMTAILRDASGKMHHGILFGPPLVKSLNINENGAVVIERHNFPKLLFSKEGLSVLCTFIFFVFNVCDYFYIKKKRSPHPSFMYYSLFGRATVSARLG